MHDLTRTFLKTIILALALPCAATATAADGGCSAFSSPYAGGYRLSDGSDLRIVQLQDRYYADFGNAGLVAVEEQARGRFRSRHGELQLDFCAAGPGTRHDVLVTRRGQPPTQAVLKPARRVADAGPR